jgi:hypothetical protein
VQPTACEGAAGKPAAKCRKPHHRLLYSFHVFDDHIGGTYRTETTARDDETVQPGLFPGLLLSLTQVWED